MPVIPTPPDATQELVQMRTDRAKVFALAGGKKRLIQKLGRVHFRDDDGSLKDIEIDQTRVDTTGEIVADQLPYRFRVHLNGVGFDYQSREGGTVRMYLTRIGSQNFNQNRTYTAERIGRRIRFADVATGLDIVFEIGRGGIKTYRVLKNSAAARSWRWNVEYDAAGEAKIDRVSIRGKDAQDRRVNVSVSNSAPQVIAGGRFRYVANESWNGEVEVTDPVTRIRSWVPGIAAFPVRIDPDITEEIAATGDDGREAYGNWYSTYMNFGVSATRHAGARFTGIALNNAVTIDLAVFKTNVTGNGFGGYAAGVVWGEDVDDAPQWSSTIRPSNRTQTTASASFPAPTATGIVSITVTSIIQELVDRAGWVSGNDINLFVLGHASSTGLTLLEDFSAAGTDEAQLEIDYTEGGGATVGRGLTRSLALNRLRLVA